MTPEGRERAIVVALDGPAASGKSTVGLAVARRLGFAFVETGKLYRALAYKALRERVALDDGKALAALFNNTKVEYELREREPVIKIDGEDVTAALGAAEVAEAASAISALPEVRAVLLPLQRRLARPPGVVVEGRDVGTVVFPDAPCKFFLDASIAERARRRARDFAARGREVDAAEVEKDLAARDRRDSARAIAPLKRAEGAVYIDTTGVAFADVVESIIERVKRVTVEGAQRG
ncbi:MAG TPA: (d)CMP kinase [bacterium]|nr:(d)CMP kinase [bacterium]